MRASASASQLGVHVPRTNCVYSYLYGPHPAHLYFLANPCVCTHKGPEFIAFQGWLCLFCYWDALDSWDGLGSLPSSHKLCKQLWRLCMAFFSKHSLEFIRR